MPEESFFTVKNSKNKVGYFVHLQKNTVKPKEQPRKRYFETHETLNSVVSGQTGSDTQPVKIQDQ